MKHGSQKVLDTVIESHRGELLRIARRHGARNLRVFGSSVRGEMRADSDIDFLVEFEPGRDLVDLSALKLDLEAVLGRPIDVVTERSLHAGIADSALRDTIPL